MPKFPLYSRKKPENSYYWYYDRKQILFMSSEKFNGMNGYPGGEKITEDLTGRCTSNWLLSDSILLNVKISILSITPDNDKEFANNLPRENLSM